MATPVPNAHLHTKRSLLALSHAMERSLDVARPERDAVHAPLVIALFQRAEYFAVEQERYRAMVDAGTLCIVAFAGSSENPPEGVPCVALSRAEPLASEWALIVLDGAMGITLAAHDINDIAPGEQTLESARLFTAYWSFSPAEAAREARRILDGLGDRLERLHPVSGTGPDRRGGVRDSNGHRAAPRSGDPGHGRQHRLGPHPIRATG